MAQSSSIHIPVLEEWPYVPTNKAKFVSLPTTAPTLSMYLPYLLVNMFACVLST